MVNRDMTAQEILSLRDHGEVTKVQFKERVIDAYDMWGALYTLPSEGVMEKMVK